VSPAGSDYDVAASAPRELSPRRQSAAAHDARLETLNLASARLRCPNCGASLTVAGRVLTCATGHAFDLSRQGDVTLTPPRGSSARGDSTGMVSARDTFLAAGHYASLADCIVAEGIAAAAQAVVEAARNSAGLVVDLGAGTGYHLAALLENLPDWHGIALDASRPALRRALRTHPRIAAIACDIWRELPLQDASAGLILDVFAPRNAHEIARILAPAGALIVVTPTPRHLRQLVADFGLLDVEADKQARLHATLSPQLESVRRRELEFDMMLGRDDVRALIAMGPSAYHLGADELRERFLGLPRQTCVTASVVMETFRHARQPRLRPDGAASA
jgi:23S rRNA (guanine745-N1)-methyltransferase